MTDARPVSSTLWAALDRVARNDPLPTLVGRDLGPLAIGDGTAAALARRGFVEIIQTTSLGPEAVLLDPGRRALETHARLEEARQHLDPSPEP